MIGVRFPSFTDKQLARWKIKRAEPECSPIDKTPCLVPRWGLLHSPWKSGSRLVTGEACILVGDEMNIQWDELTNVLLWLKNIYTRLTQKHRRGWVISKCQKTLWNIWLAIEQSLKMKNRTQHTNHQMHNAVKNHIYPKISHNTSLWTTFIIR